MAINDTSPVPVAKITGFHGGIQLSSSDQSVKVAVGTPIFLSDTITTKGASSVMVSLPNGVVFSLGHDESLTITPEFLASLSTDAESAVDQGVNFDLIEQTLADGGNLEEILPETAAGEAPATQGSGQSAANSYLRLDLAQAAVAPERGFETTALDVSADSNYVRLPDYIDPVPINNSPVVSGIGALSITQDVPVAIEVGQYFSDSDTGQTLTYDISGLPEGLSFDPATGLISGVVSNAVAIENNGNYVLQVSATDNAGQANSSVAANFDLQVVNVNDAPQAVNVSLGNLAEDVPLVLDASILLSGAIDIDGDTLSVANVIIEQGEGSLEFVDGSYVYTPATDWSGEVRFSTTITDSVGGEVVSSALLNVVAVNDAPVASNDLAISTLENVPVTINLLANDIDVDGDALQYSSISAEHGSVQINDDGSVTYTPETGYFGDDVISYTVDDGQGGSSSASAFVSIGEVNDTPVLGADVVVNVAENTSVVGNFPASDDNGDDIFYELLGDDAAQFTVDDFGNISFVNAPDFESGVSSYSVTLRATDSRGLFDDQNVSVNIGNVNDNAPVVTLSTLPLSEDAVSVGQEVAQFSVVDADNDSVTVSLVGDNALYFSVDDGKILLTDAGAEAINNDQLDLTSLPISLSVSDGVFTSVETQTVAISRVNDAPTIEQPIGAVALEEGFAPITLDLTSYFSDSETPESLTYSVTGALNLSVSIENGVATISAGLNWNGIESLEFSAIDPGGESVSQLVEFNIAPANDDPTVANLIDPTSASEDAPFSYTLASDVFTDIDGDDLTLSATLANGDPLPSWLSFDAAAGTFSGTPLNDDAGNLSIRVTATDGQGGTDASTTFALNVAEVNDAPQANPITALNLNEDFGSTTIDLNAVFSDEETLDGDLQYSVAGDDLVNVSITNGIATITSINNAFGAENLTFTATDAGGLSVDSAVAITIAPVNDDPTVANAISATSATEDTPFSYTLASDVFTDIDGDDLTLSATLANGDPLPSWLSFDAASGTFSGTPLNADAGNLSIRVSATDGQGGTDASTTFALNVAEVNDAPQANPITALNLSEDFGSTTIDLNAVFSDEETLDGDLQYSVSGDDLVNVSITNGIATITSINNAFGAENLTFTATDAGGLSVDSAVAITIASVNDDPTVTNLIDPASASEDTPFSYTLDGNIFTDIDGDDLTLSATLANGDPLPSWLSFDAAAGTFSGTPLNDDAGNLSIRVTATDSQGGTDASTTFALNVAEVNDAPQANPITALNLNEDFGTTTIDLNAVFSDEETLDGDLQYSVSGDDLVNVSITNGIATITSINNAFGAENLTFTATDAGGLSVDSAVAITIAPVNDDPTVANAISATSATEDTPFSYTLASDVFTDIDGDDLTLSATLANGDPLPSWLSFDAAAGTFSGTPLHDDAGNLSIRVSATDGQGGTDASTTFALEVQSVNDAPQATTIDPLNLSEDFGTATIDLNAVFSDEETLDGDLQYSVAGDDLVNVSITNGIATITSINNAFGAENLTFTATDAGGLSVDSAVAITIAPVNDDPTVANAISATSATEDTPFSYTLDGNIFTDIDGDDLTLSATLANGDPLPSWLSFDAAAGTFSGTPLNDDAGNLSIRVTATDGQGGTNASTTFALNVAEVNDAPQANPITALNLNEDFGSTTIDLNAVFSDEETLDGDLQYSVSGDDLVNVSITNGIATITSINNAFGAENLTFTATDAGGLSVDSAVAITIAPVNDDPTVANAISATSASEDTPFSYTLDGNVFTDIDGDDLTLSATLANGDPLPSWLSFDAAAGTFSGTPLNDDAGNLSIRVSATDGQGGTDASTTFALEVQSVNDAPQANPITALNLNEDFGSTTIDLNAVFSDEETLDGDLQYSVSGDDLVNVSITNGIATITSINNAFGAENLTFTATDAGGLSVDSAVAITIAPVNDDPTVANAISATSASEDTPFSYTLDGNVFTDIDGDDLTLSATLANGDPLPSWLSFDANTGTFSGTPLNDDAGNLSIRVTATDGQGGTDASTTFALNVAEVNDAPQANPITALNLSEDFGTTTIDLNAVFSDEETLDGDLQYSVSGDDLVNVSITNGIATITSINNAFGAENLTFTATDAGGLSVDSAVAITIAPVNDDPTVANLIDPASASEDTPFSYTLASDVFTDIDGDDLTLSATLANGDPLPSWLSFDAAAGTFSGTPLNDDAGNLSIRVIATDGQGGTDASTTFALEVQSVNDAPQANPITALNLNEDFGSTTIDLNAVFSDEETLDGDLQYSVAGDDLVNVSITNGIATITSINNAFGAENLTFTATDAGGLSVDSAVAITIAPVNDDPTVANAISATSATEDTPFSYTLASDVFTDIDGDDLTLSATLANGDPLPSWLSFDAAAGTFSGTPLNDDAGNLSIRVTATDGQGGTDASTTFAVAVQSVNDAPQANPITALNLNEDFGTTTIDLNAVFSDEETLDGDLQYSVAGDDLVNVSITNGIATITSINNAFGAENLTFTATDAGGLSVDSAVAITIAPVNDDPTVANAISATSAAEDTPFSYTLASDVFTDIDGDDLTLSATLANGDPLPSWLSFDANTGTFSGTPLNDDAGNLSIRVTATDGQGGTDASTTFALNVAEVNDAPQANPITALNLSEDFGTTTIDLNAVFSDEETLDGDLQYSVAGDDLVNVSITNGIATITSINNAFGAENLTFTATDAGGLSVDSAVAITIAPVNDDPTVANAISATSATEDTPFSYTLDGNVFTDIDGDDLTLSATLANGDPLPSWLSFDAAAGTFSGTPLNNDAGNLSIRVSATDGQGGTDASTTFALEVQGVNDAPQANPITALNLSEDFGTTTIDLNAVFSDEETLDGDLQYSVSGDDLVNVSITNGIATITSISNAFGAENLTFTATDAGGLSVDSAVAITIAPVNDDPTVANLIDPTSATEDTPFSYTLASDVFTDIDGDDLTLSATLANGDPLPSWLSFDANTGTFSGTPLNDDAGNLSIRVTATDGQGGTDASTTFALEVQSVNDAPQATTIDPLNLSEDFGSTTIDLNTIFSDEESPNSALEFSVTGDSNVSVSITDGVATLSSTADWSGTENLIFIATDESNASTSVGAEINVTAVADAPTISIVNNPQQVVEADLVPVSTGLSLRYYQRVSFNSNGSEKEGQMDGLAATSEARVLNGLGSPKILSNTDEIQSDGSTINIPTGAGFAISGFIYLEQGHSYQFEGYHDDVIRVELGGTTMLSTAGNSWGQFGAGTSLPGSSFTPSASGYYTLEAYVANNLRVGQFSLNLSVDGEAAQSLTADNFNIYSSLADITALGGNVGAFIAGADNPDGGYFADVENSGLSGAYVSLSQISALVTDLDGSESITQLQIAGIPEGAILTDGDLMFTATAANSSIDLMSDDWDASSLMILPPADFVGEIALSVTATSEEASNGDQATSAETFTVTVIDSDSYASGLDVDVQNDRPTIVGTSGNDLLAGDNEETLFVALGGDDVVTGGSRSDFILGGSGSDNISAGGGSDTISLGAGADTVSWGVGDNDSSIDTLTDLDLSEDVLDFSELLDGESADAATLDAYFDFALDGSDTIISIDSNGDGSGADLTVVVQGIDLLGIYGNTDLSVLTQLLDNGNLHTD